MFERYILLHPAISKMYLKESSMPYCLEEEELAELESICQTLKPFEAATEILSKDQTNSISDALIVILEIEQHINKAKSNNLMTKKFRKYWNVIADHVLIAHVLDPRYKMEHLRATLIEIGGYTESEAEQYINNIRQKIIACGEKYTSLHSTSSTTKIDEEPALNVSFFKRRVSKRCRISTDTIDYELELYEREPLEEFENDNINKENNGMLHWKLLSKRFPILSKMACDYLSIQPSSVASERAFSRAGFTITSDRANLNEKTVTCTILMHSWLKESQKQSNPLNDLLEIE